MNRKVTPYHLAKGPMCVLSALVYNLLSVDIM